MLERKQETKRLGKVRNDNPGCFACAGHTRLPSLHTVLWWLKCTLPIRGDAVQLRCDKNILAARHSGEPHLSPHFLILESRRKKKFKEGRWVKRLHRALLGLMVYESCYGLYAGSPGTQLLLLSALSDGLWERVMELFLGVSGCREISPRVNCGHLL